MESVHPNSEIKPLYAGSGGSRIRISKRLFTALGWASHTDHFDCIGVFRNIGEFLISPLWVKTDEDTHPFEVLFSYEQPPSSQNIMPINDIPPTRVITAANRISRIQASWTKSKEQLDLKVGVAISRRLGWEKSSNPPIYPIVWGSFLVLISEKEFFRAQSEDFTGGHLQT